MLRARKLTSCDCCLLLSCFEWVGFFLFLFFANDNCYYATHLHLDLVFNSKPGSKPKSCTLPQKILAWLTATKSHFTLSVPPLLGWDGCITPKGHTDALENAELSLSCDFISTERLQTWNASTRCSFPELKIDVREEFFGVVFFSSFLTKISRCFIFFSPLCCALYVVELPASRGHSAGCGKIRSSLGDKSLRGVTGQVALSCKSTHWHVFITSTNISSISPPDAACVVFVCLCSGLGSGAGL